MKERKKANKQKVQKAFLTPYAKWGYSEKIAIYVEVSPLQIPNLLESSS